MTIPPADTPPRTYHWLYRATGQPQWMAAMWTGAHWWTPAGLVEEPHRLAFWTYVCRARLPAPPGRRKSKARRKRDAQRYIALLERRAAELKAEEEAHD